MITDKGADLLSSLGPDSAAITELGNEFAVIHSHAPESGFTHSARFGEKTVNFGEQFGGIHAGHYNGLFPTVNGEKPLSCVGVRPTRIGGMRIREDWRERLTELVEKAGGNRKAISLTAKLNETYLRDILEKNQTPQLRSAEKLSKSLGAPITAWFIAADDDDVSDSDLEAAYTPPEVASGYLPIGRYDTSFSMGPGSLVAEHPTPLGYMVFEEQWVHTLSTVAPANLAVVKVDGDSMMPTLQAGDLVLIDRTKTRPNREGIYALRVGDIAWVKRISVNLKTQKIRVLSDNPLVPRQPEMDEEDLSIIGRVIALVARKMP